MAVMSKDQRLSPDLVKAVAEILESLKGSLVKWTTIKKLLAEAKITYIAKLKPQLMLVHPKNREGCGLNPSDAHENLEVISEIGGDPDAVRHATCIETNPAMKSFQVQFNEVLIERSEGLLAPVNGTERFLSLSCSHMAAGCRAAAAGCRAHCESMADASGNISMQTLIEGDSALKALMEDGWEWLVLPAFCEAVWPSLPELIQGALNAEHAVGKNAGELQVMCSIGSMQYRDASKSQAHILKIIKGTKPACTPYLECLYKYVQLFGGGQGAPMIRFMEGFAKEFGSNRVIGETFWQSCLDTKLGPIGLYPHVRNALVVANLICPKKKIAEGFARLITKTDVNMLGKPKNALAVNSSEMVLQQAWDALAEKLDAGTLTVPQRNRLYGVLASRLACFLCSKGKDSLEAVQYKSVKDIKEKHSTELNAALGAGEEQFAEEVVEETPATLADASDPRWVAQQEGFELGKCFKAKNEPHIYKLVSFETTRVKFERQELNADALSPGERANLMKTVLYQQIMDVFEKREWKGKMPELCPKDMVDDLTYVSHPVYVANAHKASIYLALLRIAEQKSMDAYVDFIIPHGAQTNDDMSKGSLRLYPVTDMTKINMTSVTSSHTVTGQGQSLCLDAPRKPSTIDDRSTKKQGTVCVGFWWVKEVVAEADANMHMTTEKVDGYTIPVMVNRKTVKKHERLSVFLEKSKKART
jgi:hypothetical protein